MKVIGTTTNYRNHISKTCEKCGKIEKAIKLTEMRVAGEWIKVCYSCFMERLNHGKTTETKTEYRHEESTSGKPYGQHQTL